MNYYRETLRKYKVFTGRASRKEYWHFALFQGLVVIALTIIDLFVGTFGILFGLSLFSGLYALATLIPSLAAMVRRVHDTGHSSASLLLALIPFVGPIIILVFLLSDSQPGDNVYGPNSKAAVLPVSQ